LSFGWWVEKHNLHHANPNTEGADPDIGDGVLAFTSAQAANRTSWFGRAMARSQAWLFFPLLLLEGLNLHVASIRALWGRPRRRRSRPIEIALLAIHVAAYFTVLFVFLTPGQAFAFIGVQQGLFGLYMGISFAPNHKGMPILSADDDSDYMRRQVITSRNVRGGRMTDFVFGGLNYQIEHHLFPSMPRPNLRRSQALVAAFCRQKGVPYCESSLIGSYLQAMRHLHAVGRASAPVAASGQP
jgi:fatty acid desaturase